MAEYSIGEALSIFLERNKWKQKAYEIRLRNEWEQVTGKTIARYTRSIALKDRVLTIFTDVAALKQEIMFSKGQLIQTINTYFSDRVVDDIMVR